MKFCYTVCMKLTSQQLKLLGLSKSEVAVLNALREGQNTPLLVSKSTNISRSAIYEMLERLQKRGLIKRNIINGKKYWSQAKKNDLEQDLYETKKALFGIEDGVKEVHGASDSSVVIHRGGTAIRKLLRHMMTENKDQRLYGIQGNVVTVGWNKIFGIEGTNELNRHIKSNHIITEAILPEGWAEYQTRVMGKEWAKDFEGRMAMHHCIDNTYFEHGGQVFIFKNSLYLMAMNEEIIIEVRNSEIQKLILSMFRFIQNNSKKIDINEILRKLIAEQK